MPSKFGGIPVEAGGSKFGGVPVREQPELSLATSATDSRPAPGYSGELPQSKPTENDKRKAWYSGIPIVQQLASAVDAAQHHVLNIPVAAGQGAAHMADWVGDKLSPRDEWDQGPSRTTRNVDAAVRQREADYQRRTGSLGGSYVGAAVGEILPWMTGMGELRAAGLLPKIAGTGVKATAKKGALLAVEGATMGAAQPVLGDGGYGRQKAAQIGIGAVAAPATAGALGGLGKGARYLTPKGRDAIANQRLAAMFGSDPATIAALRQGGWVSGFQPTAEQVLATPEAVQAARLLRNNAQTAPAFARREAENNKALRDVVAGIAKTDADVAAAKAARKAATDPYYAQLAGNAVDPAPVLKALDDLAGSSMGVRPNIKTAASGLRSEILSRLDKGGKIDASILSGLRENASSHLGPLASAQEKKALGPIADSIADTLDAAVPGYRANLEAYASGSQPITDMAAGRKVLDAIDRGGRDALGNPTVDLAKIRAALAKDDRAKFKMSPQARAVLESVLKAAQQRSIANNNIAASGPGTAADAMRGAAASPYGQRIGSGIAALLGSSLGGLDAGLGALALTEGAAALNNNIVRRVGGKAANANELADALEAYRAALNSGKQSGTLPYLSQPLLPYQTTP